MYLLQHKWRTQNEIQGQAERRQEQVKVKKRVGKAEEGGVGRQGQ
jgi:hypothetical protein